MPKTYSFGALGEKLIKDLEVIETKPSTQTNKDMISDMKLLYDDLLYKYSSDLYQNDYYTTLTSTHQLPSYQPNYSSNPSYKWTINTNDIRTHTNPHMNTYDSCLKVTLEDGTVATVSREELVKYIGERKLIQENEIVRKMYDRYRVAAKLAGSDDNGDTRV